MPSDDVRSGEIWTIYGDMLVLILEICRDDDGDVVTFLVIEDPDLVFRDGETSVFGASTFFHNGRRMWPETDAGRR